MRRHMPARIGSLALVVAVALGMLGVMAGSARARSMTASPACPLGASALALAETPVPGCGWPVVARAADAFVARPDCTIDGTDGDDVLVGTGDRDVICGRQGDDVIKALDGNDLVFGGSGKDRIRGGPGQDRLHGEDGSDRIRGGRHTDQIFGQFGNDRLSGDGWSDFLTGGYGNDRMDGGLGSDYAFDSFGNDVASLGAGSDQFYSDRGVDLVRGGTGSDLCLTVADGKPGDVVDGGPGTEDAFDTDPSDAWTNVEVGPRPCIGC